MIKKNIIIAFDLDGTLLDSADDLIDTLNILLEDLNIPLVQRSNIKNLVGNGALAMIRKAFLLNKIEKNEIELEILKDKFLNIYKKNYANKSKLFPYAKEILTKIRSNKYEMILVSNKPEYYVKKIIHHFHIDHFFSAVSGGDTFKYRKPDPRHLYETIKLTGIKNYNCIFIGDSISDASCAKNSKSKLILLKHGYSDIDINTMKADIILDDLKNIPDSISKLYFNN